MASKLSKPGEKKEEKVEEVKQQIQASTPAITGNIIDIFEVNTPALSVQPKSQPTAQLSVQSAQPVLQPPQPLVQQAQ